MGRLTPSQPDAWKGGKEGGEKEKKKKGGKKNLSASSPLSSAVKLLSRVLVTGWHYHDEEGKMPLSCSSVARNIVSQKLCGFSDCRLTFE